MVTPFSGTYNGTPGSLACDSPKPFTVPANTRQIVAVATADVPANDIILYLLAPDGTILASSDTATSPEAIAYSPTGAIPAGTYSVQVCPFADPTAPADRTIHLQRYGNDQRHATAGCSKSTRPSGSSLRRTHRSTIPTPTRACWAVGNLCATARRFQAVRSSYVTRQHEHPGITL